MIVSPPPSGDTAGCPAGSQKGVRLPSRMATVEATPDLTVPLDDEHEQSARAVRIIRQQFVDAAERAARWQPRPCPEIDLAVERLNTWRRP